MKFISNTSPTGSFWSGIVAPRRPNSGCNATPSDSNIMRVLRLITGLTFTRFGINEQRELPTKHTNRYENFGRYKTPNLSYFSRVSWALSRSRIGLGSHNV